MTDCCRSDSSLVLNAEGAAVSPSRLDPTRTLKFREAFIREIKRRNLKLKKAILQWIYKEDKLGLRVKPRKLLFNEREYEFMSDPAKLAAFSTWVEAQILADLLFAETGTGVISTGVSAGKVQGVTGIGFGGSMGTGPWTMKYIESAYKKGLINSYLASRRGLDKSDPAYIDKSQEEFLRSAFLAPERISKVQLLAARAFEQLKGFNAQMGSQLNTILAQGMIDGKGALQIAREMVDKIDDMTEKQALRIARTEIIRAHAEGQLDALEELGVSEVGVLVEWTTAKDARVCPICADMEGVTFTIDEARGKIPAHPNCRCAFVPRIP